MLVKIVDIYVKEPDVKILDGPQTVPIVEVAFQQGGMTAFTFRSVLDSPHMDVQIL